MIKELLKDKKPLIGMVHCLPLLNTPGFKNNMDVVIKRAVEDAKELEAAGIHAIIVENMGDGPLGKTLDFEQQIGLAVVTAVVCQNVSIPVGIDAAFNDYKASLCIAKNAGAQFVRIPVFVDTVVNHLGICEPCAREALYYRKSIGAEDIQIWGDIQVKYTRMLLKDVPIEESARIAESMGADAVIVTGVGSGFETPIDAIKMVKKHVKIPVIAGSGIDTKNVSTQMALVDGAIVGSSLKIDKNLQNPINRVLVDDLMKAYRGK